MIDKRIHSGRVIAAPLTVTCLALFMADLTGQETQAALTDDSPLRADPGNDQLVIADMLFDQATQSRNDPAEFSRLMALAAERYAAYLTQYPKTSQSPAAAYRMATALKESGQKKKAMEAFASIVRDYKGEMAAGAAWHLAAEASSQGDWKSAERYFTQVLDQSVSPELRSEAEFWLARAYSQQKQTDKAIPQYRKVIDNPATAPAIRQQARMAQAGLLAESGKYDDAYAAYEQLLAVPGLDNDIRGRAMIRKSALASILGKYAEAESLYNTVIKDPALAAKKAEAQSGLMMTLYRQQNYAGVLRLFDQGLDKAAGQAIRGRWFAMAAQSAFKIKDYGKAAELFALAEQNQPDASEAMESAYGRIMAKKELKDVSIERDAERFLEKYPTAADGNSSLPEMVKWLAADTLVGSHPQKALAFYNSIDSRRIDKGLRPELAYRTAWVSNQSGDREKALELLDNFISEYENDKLLPDAYALRGDLRIRNGEPDKALADFLHITSTWPDHPSTGLYSWQKRAALYDKKQDTDGVIQSYRGLIEYFPRAPRAVLADAWLKIGLGLYQKDQYREAVPCLTKARDLDPERYSIRAERYLANTWYQLKDFARLKETLDGLSVKNPAALNDVPSAVKAWLGMRSFEDRDYRTAERYLSLVDQAQDMKKYHHEINRNLAVSRLALHRYDEALGPIDAYLAGADQPYDLGRGMLYKSAILTGLKRYDEAKQQAEGGLALGVEGVLSASLRIMLGDIAYRQQDYEEAARQYATTAELYSSDAKLRPEALYKAGLALQKAGKAEDARQYEAMLQRDYPDWRPEENGAMQSHLFY